MLPWDQIPRERRAIGDFTSRLGDDGHNGVLAVALAQWMARDDSKADPGARRAANTAMDAIDAMLRELHTLRQVLITEIRGSDDETARRADELLAKYRAGGTYNLQGGFVVAGLRTCNIPCTLNRDHL